MMIAERVNKLLGATNSWLEDESGELQSAVDQTVEEDYFARHDVVHALRAIRRSLVRDDIMQWIEPYSSTDAGRNNILCLHAGNLPLVGFQDVFATILSGANYYGKISRKDPYLLPSYLRHLQSHGLVEVGAFSTDLASIPATVMDGVMFAGSEESVPDVRRALNELSLTGEQTRWLIRTAHFSIAYLDSKHPQHMKDLTEAIFRYGGKGCRSVAIVVSPFSLDEIKCELTDYIESFWLENPQHQQPGPGLKFRFAYNKAVERSQAWLDDFLLQEGGLEFDRDFVTYWVRGKIPALKSIFHSYEDEIQNVYLTSPEISVDSLKLESRVDMLSNAQQPPINWQPDGQDVLRWLFGIS